MATSIIDRLTAAIRVADQCLHNTQFQADVINWTECRNVMLIARDELGRSNATDMGERGPTLTDLLVSASSPSGYVKLDGRTKEARAAKAAQ